MTAVIFDFDGVLANSVPVYRRAVIETMEGLGVTGSQSAMIDDGDTRTVARQLIDHHNLNVELESLTGAIERNALDQLLTVPSIVPGARELLTGLTTLGVPLAIASLAPRRNILTVLRQDGLEKYFGWITGVEDVRRFKPDPEVFLTAADGLGVTPDGCLAIEDSDSGVAAARAAGMIVVALTTTLPAERLQEAHKIVPRLADLNPETLADIFREFRQDAD